MTMVVNHIATEARLAQTGGKLIATVDVTRISRKRRLESTQEISSFRVRIINYGIVININPILQAIIDYTLAPRA